MRFLDDPLSMPKEISPVVNLGIKTVGRIIDVFEAKILDKTTVSGITFIIYKFYGELYRKQQAIQKQQQKRQRKQGGKK